jgi:ABC-type multidrug transport system fused ATPase/permease subunit
LRPACAALRLIGGRTGGCRDGAILTFVGADKKNKKGCVSMEHSLFRYIVRHSLRHQIILLILTVASFPFLYIFLDLPKVILNKAIQGSDFPKTYFGFEFDQLEYLFALCAIFLLLVIVNQAFKYVINVYKGLLGERMLRRLRYDLFMRVLRFPLPHFRRTSAGETIPMITSEVEPLGGYIAEAIATPAYQGGTLLTILVFLFVQDPLMGLAAISLYPIQIYLIPKLQRKVNNLGKTRVRLMRKVSDRIGETITGIQEIRSNDTAAYELADFANRMNGVFWVRYEIYIRKFFIKFLNNFISQLGPFFFFTIGGYLVIKGQLSIGALVAVISAYKELYSPWKELLAYYQMKEDARIKYEQVVAQFEPAGMIDPDRLLSDPPKIEPFTGEIVLSGVSLADEGEIQLLEGVSLHLPLDAHTAVVGGAGSGKHELALILARLADPQSGRVTIGGQDLASLPDAVVGRRIAFVGASTVFFNGALADNLLYGLKHRPVIARELDGEAKRLWERDLNEARRSGNCEWDINADWIDYDAVGGEGIEAVERRMIEALKIVRLDDDVFALGLRGRIDPEAEPERAARVLEGREKFHSALGAEGLGKLVEPFEVERWNDNASVAENLLFGAPRGDGEELEALVEHPFVEEVLTDGALDADLVEAGRRIAATMIELFADLPPDHEFFEQYSFISSEDLPGYQMLLNRIEREGVGALDAQERRRLVGLALQLIPARHRLDVLDDRVRERILVARKRLMEHGPGDLKARIEFFDRTRYHARSSIQDNILFGRIVHGQAQARGKVGQKLAQVIDEAELRDVVMAAGLAFQVGSGGSRLSNAQRQKAAIARALLKRPDLLVLSEATSAVDTLEQVDLVERLREAMAGHCIVWSLQRPALARSFDRVVVMQGGRVAQTGTPDEIDQEGSAFRRLTSEG